jgi:hypothetical protein
VETLVALSSDDIEVGDAHGAGQGHDALRRWADSVTSTAELGKIYVHDGIVVVELTIRSKDVAAGSSTAAAAFRVIHDHVTSVFRHDDLASALTATELTEADLAD